MNEHTTTGRRSFLLATGTWIAGASATGFAANESIRVGCLGTGGRCRTLMKSLANVPSVTMTALSDAWETALNEAKKIADPKAVASRNYREILDRKDIDAVLIGSPDHWHVPMTIDACKAGKDVYVEKPLTHDLSEGKSVVAAQNEHKRIVQVGTQQRSMTHIVEARDIIQSGGIGRVVKVHMTWNRNTDRVKRFKDTIDPKTVDWKSFLGTARPQEYDEYRFRNWRWFWDFGGGIFTDLMVHWIDVAHWILKVDHPEKAVSHGEHLNSKGVWETPDTVQTILSYPGGVQMSFEGTFANAHRGAMITFMGSEANLYIDRGGYVLTPERNKKGTPKERILGSGPRGADFYDKPDGELLHLQNWIDCVKSRRTPNAPAEGGVSSASAAHLANRAMREGGVAVWKDPA
jgi:predicted dehydrogenase